MTKGRRSLEWDLTLEPSEYEGVFVSYSLLRSMQSKNVGNREDKQTDSKLQYLSYKPRLQDWGIHYCK